MLVVARSSWRQEQRHLRSIVGKTTRTNTDSDSESYVNDIAMSVAPVRAVRGTGHRHLWVSLPPRAAELQSWTNGHIFWWHQHAGANQ